MKAKYTIAEMELLKYNTSTSNLYTMYKYSTWVNKQTNPITVLYTLYLIVCRILQGKKEK